MNSLYQKLSFSHWNIGFLDGNSETALNGGFDGGNAVRWLNHGFDDRFFADPFLLSADGDTVKVLSEELIFSDYTGRLVCLTCNCKTGALLERKVALELETHLSFPQILRRGGDVFIIPENAESGRLSAFCYDEKNDSATFSCDMIAAPLVDAVIFEHGGRWWCLADRADKNCCKELFVYSAETLFGEWDEIPGSPFLNDLTCGRNAGSVFRVGGKIFRPAQNCLGGYGKGVEIREITELSVEKGLRERPARSIKPFPGVFGDGLHTLNFLETPGGSIGVVDGNRLEFSPLQKIVSVYGRALRNKLHF